MYDQAIEDTIVEHLRSLDILHYEDADGEIFAVAAEVTIVTVASESCWFYKTQKGVNCWQGCNNFIIYFKNCADKSFLRE